MTESNKMADDAPATAIAPMELDAPAGMDAPAMDKKNVATDDATAAAPAAPAAKGATLAPAGAAGSDAAAKDPAADPASPAEKADPAARAGIAPAKDADNAHQAHQAQLPSDVDDAGSVKVIGAPTNTFVVQTAADLAPWPGEYAKNEVGTVFDDGARAPDPGPIDWALQAPEVGTAVAIYAQAVSAASGTTFASGDTVYIASGSHIAPPDLAEVLDFQVRRTPAGATDRSGRPTATLVRLRRYLRADNPKARRLRFVPTTFGEEDASGGVGGGEGGGGGGGGGGGLCARRGLLDAVGFIPRRLRAPRPRHRRGAR